jgi:hypothetical protein
VTLDSTGVLAAWLLVLDALSKGSADRGPTVSVAVDGFDSDPVSIFPMNHAGTQPLSPVSDLILLYQRGTALEP